MPIHTSRLSTVPALLSFVLTAFVASRATSAAEPVRSIEPDDSTGIAAATIVGNVPLVHTAQILPTDAKGEILAKDRPRMQIKLTLQNVQAALSATGSSLDRAVKLNVYTVGADVADDVRKMLAEEFRGKPKPAVSFVVGKLTHRDAMVAMDAVAVCSEEVGGVRRLWIPNLPRIANASHAGVLPPGTRVYISGQAEKGKDMAEATRLTMESLKKSLEFLKLSSRDVVQVKSFLGPIGSAAEAEREILQFFGDDPAPPLVFVEWTSSLPIEIELIASARHLPNPAEPVEYLTPPEMTASPVYSRIARVRPGDQIYISGLYGQSMAKGEAETNEIFARLGELLPKAGTDFRHLAKATYYCATDEASTKLNEIRPRFYDPKRPPAASKAIVAGTGMAGRSITLDLIAVPK